MKTLVCHLVLAVGLTLQAVAESHTTNILDGVTNDVGGPFTLGDAGPLNFLLITNGGALSNTVGTLGNALDAHSNLAIVTGTNSVWHHGSNFILGATGGMNQVSVLNGARMNVDRQAFIGLDRFSANNLLFVSGSGTFLDMPWFHLGQAGPGNQIIVTDGAGVGRGISNDVLNNIGDEEGSGGNLLLVAGPGTVWFTDGFRVGNRGWRNQAVVRDGARLTNGFLTVGREISAMANTVQVQGAGSVWKVQNPSVFIGFNGSSNQLQISDAGRFDTPQATIGLSNAAMFNVAALWGPGTVWANAGSLTVGDAGPLNSLSVGSGAILRSGSISIGNNSANNRAFINDAFVFNTADLRIGTSSNAFSNLLSLSGPGTIWTNADRVALGKDGSDNRLAISDGAVFRLMFVFTTDFSIGAAANSRGNDLTITGAGSALLGNWALTVGSSGSANRLFASDGARLQSSSADIGQNCVARDNLALITGAGTVWSNGTLQVGFCSVNNHLVVSNGAQLFAGLVRSSVQGGASNTITVTGPGSLLRAAGDVIVGNSGTANSLLILDGARVEGHSDRVGWGGGNNAALLRGTDTSWSNVSLTIGDASPGNHLGVADGARLASGSAIFGAGAKSSGNEAALSGAGTIWNITTNLMVGGLGHSNCLSLSEGANLSSRGVYLGAGSLLNPTALFNSDWNRLVLGGTNVVLNCASNLIVGASGRWNRTEIRDAAQVADHDGAIGFYGRSNSVLVAGNGSAWRNAGNLLIGSNGTRSELIISQAGLVTANAGYIGFNGELEGEGSSCVVRFGGNNVLVTGPGSVWSNSERLYVGYGSIGNTLVVSNGGTVRAAGLLVGNTNGFQPGSACGFLAPLNQLVIEGGCLSVSNTSGDAILEVRHGSLTLQSGVVSANRLLATNKASSSLFLHGGTLRIHDGLLENPGTGAGAFVVGDNMSSATLLLEGGTLIVQPGLRIAPFAVLAGNGELNAPLKNVSGTIAPGGHGPGRLSLVGGLFSMEGGAASFSIDIEGTEAGAHYDQVVLDAALFAGRIDVRLRGGFVPQPDDAFEVIRSTYVIEPDSLLYNVSPVGRLFTVDHLGSFQVRFSGTNVVLTDYHSTDLDDDGIEDAWAMNSFGHTPLSAAEKLADPDGDGASNYDEFKGGTNPLNPASVFRVSITYSSTPRTLEFPCVPGKEYRVWYSNDLLIWREVPNPTFVYYSSGVCDWTDDGKDTGGLDAASHFYRVTVE